MSIDDELLRQGVRELLSSPTAVPPDAQVRVQRAVRRRRLRMRAATVVGTVAAVSGVLAVGTLVGDVTSNVAPGTTAASGEWQPIAASPLSPRDAVASVWTGKEMLIVGGTTLGPCNDTGTADCAGPARDDVVADGAAYDPSTDTWRTIAPAPSAFYGGHATWTGNSMVVLVPRVSGVQSAATLVYKPTSDAWRTLDPPPAP